MATGSAGRLQPAPAGQGAGDCSSMEQSQQVPTGKASSPVGDIRFITQTSELGSPNTLEPSLRNPCQLLAESHGKEKHTLKRGEIFQWWQSCLDCPGFFPCNLTWAVSFPCVCVYMQELFQDKKLPSGVYSWDMLCTTWYSLPVQLV